MSLRDLQARFDARAAGFKSAIELLEYEVGELAKKYREAPSPANHRALGRKVRELDIAVRRASK
ncbi:MAG: hypothetical protein A3J75_04970 [Acidobacteria bacterium RBG_16_68_9]|nr:MAG: hypothetical protein A3J75_04970 [Acidobacteria bacterium RBG_16_68_9]